MISGAGWILCSTGVLIILLAAIGIIRLPDAMSRQHAALSLTCSVSNCLQGTQHS